MIYNRGKPLGPVACLKYVFHKVVSRNINMTAKWNNKQVWKGLGCWEGNNLSSIGSPCPASTYFNL